MNSECSNISTILIMEAMNYYSGLGYVPFTVPLVVDDEVSDLTKPDIVQSLYHQDKVYVGSAEQSFLQLYKHKDIYKKNGKNGKYFAVTPCYRQELILDELHYLVFLKIELFVIPENNAMTLHRVLGNAFGFFDGYTKDIEIRALTYRSYDIFVNDIEVGSYGIRNLDNKLSYIYGTGLAEPRFSYAVSKNSG